LRHFTDLVAVEGGKVIVTKVPSTPKSLDIFGAAVPHRPGVDLSRIEDLGHGSTATNAVLGAKALVVATAGFHLLFMQRHDRRSICDLFYAARAAGLPQGLLGHRSASRRRPIEGRSTRPGGRRLIRAEAAATARWRSACSMPTPILHMRSGSELIGGRTSWSP
jgi:hypothetical protein